MVYVFLGFFVLSSAITANKVLLYTLPPSLLIAIRMLIPGIIMFYLSKKKEHGRLSKQMLQKDLFLILGCCICTTFLPSLLKAFALKNLPSSKQAFLGSLDPFIAAVYGYFIFKETLTRKKIIGLLLGFIGVFILLSTSSKLESTMPSIWIFSYPELAMLIAVCISRFGWTIVQKVLREERYTPMEFNSLLMIASGVLSTMISITTEDLSSLSLKSPLPLFLFLIVYTIIVGNMAGYNLYAQILKKYSTAFVALAGFSVPISVHFFGYLFLGEKLSVLFIIAIAITLSGLLIFYQDEPKRK